MCVTKIDYLHGYQRDFKSNWTPVKYTCVRVTQNAYPSSTHWDPTHTFTHPPTHPPTHKLVCRTVVCCWEGHFGPLRRVRSGARVYVRVQIRTSGSVCVCETHAVRFTHAENHHSVSCTPPNTTRLGQTLCVPRGPWTVDGRVTFPESAAVPMAPTLRRPFCTRACIVMFFGLRR